MYSRMSDFGFVVPAAGPAAELVGLAALAVGLVVEPVAVPAAAVVSVLSGLPEPD